MQASAECLKSNKLCVQPRDEWKQKLTAKREQKEDRKAIMLSFAVSFGENWGYLLTK